MPVNWGVVDVNLPAKIGSSFYDGQKEQAANALMAAQLQHAQSQNELGRFAYAKAQRDDADTNALRAALQGVDISTPEGQAKARQAYLGVGNVAGALSLTKSLDDQAKAKLDRQETEGKIQKQKLEYFHSAGRDMAGDPSDENISRWAKLGMDNDIFDVATASANVSKMLGLPPMERSRAMAAMGATAAEQLARFTPKISLTNDGQVTRPVDLNATTNPTMAGASFQMQQTPGQVQSAADAALARGVTLRGQNMTDARARETLNQGKIPSGYRQTSGGGLEYIPGGPADPNSESGKPLTEVQAKGVGFATRASQASKIIENIGESGRIQPGLVKRSLEAVPWVGGGLGTLANVTQSAEQQQIEQAQRNFVNAILRQESGAAISDGEFANAQKQYFPQPGDSPTVIQQKAQNRDASIRALETQAGLGMRRAAKPNVPQIGDVIDGYVYGGGDPSKESSWKKKP